MRLQFLLSEIWIGLRRNLSMAISVILVTMVSMYLLGLGLLAQRQVDTFKGYWYDRVQVTVFLCTEDSGQPNCNGKAVTDEQKETVKTQLESMKPLVKNVYFETEQQAYDRFQKQFRNSPVSGNVSVGDIPQNYRVQLSDPSKYDVIVSTFEGAPGVGAVQDQKKVLDKFFKGINYVTYLSFALAALMVLAAILLMSTTIRQAAFTRRREIGIMKLVGASNFTIRFPFMMETLISALIGAGAAIGLLWTTAHFGFNRYLNRIVNQAFIGTSDVWAISPWILAGVTLLALGTAWVTLWRYLRV
ncbi:MAG: permease-like cell division protein FtsX [Micrococcales bacterium]|nr:permease-like cell division protein FtsX [Micrococcales bacterium]